MAGVLVLCMVSVAVAEAFVGHSNLAFAAAIIALVLANARMLTFNCPKCGRNLFFCGALVVPWPSRMCRACGYDCDRRDAVNTQNR